MQRQRGGSVPIGEVIGGLDGPVKAIREASPQARHHFTLADQVDRLVAASEADSDRGFMARMMALCSRPRTNRQPQRVQARQRPLHALHDGGRRKQAPFWQSAAPIAGLALYRTPCGLKTVC